MTEQKVTKRRIIHKVKVGERFGRLEVLENMGIIKACTHFKCKCECGNIKTVAEYSLRGGRTNSCGCLRGEKCITHGMTETPTYKTWEDMIQRCTNSNNSNYKNYGDRGITVCAEWLQSFVDFFEDMGEKPKGLTIDRRNNNLGYFKENCRWATRTEQARNKRVQIHNKTGVNGVSWLEKCQKYRV